MTNINEPGGQIAEFEEGNKYNGVVAFDGLGAGTNAGVGELCIKDTAATVGFGVGIAVGWIVVGGLHIGVDATFWALFAFKHTPHELATSD